MMEGIENMSIEKGIYRHYKGNLYEVIDVATHSEDLEPMVVYRALYGEEKLWVRPAGMWQESVEVDGRQVRRFELVESRYSYEDLLGVIARLRAKDGCPWDREQTPHTIKKHLIEECYEALDALESGNPDRFCDELGDLLFQIVFHAQMAKDNGDFDMGKVVHGCANKMITRHPKVFGEGDIPKTSEEQLRQWDKIKEKEKGMKTFSDLLDDIPVSQPAMMRSLKIQQRVAKVGFEWEDIENIYAKVEEELSEVKEALALKKLDSVEEELGDLIFITVNLARFIGVQPELALNKTNEKFIRRFKYIEQRAREIGVALEVMELDEMDRYWEEAKNEIG